MKRILIFVGILVVIGCSQDTTEEKSKHELPKESISVANDSIDSDSGSLDPDVGDWKPGGSSSADMTEKR